MNRIKEWRDRRGGMSRKELGALIGLSQHQVGRYERGESVPDIDILDKMAAALECDRDDLYAMPADISPDVAVADTPDSLPNLSAILGQRGIQFYSVLTEVLADAGIRAGMTIAMGRTQAEIETVKAGDIVLVHLAVPDVLLLRQVVPPHLLVTNKFGTNNTSIKLNDKSLNLKVVGVLVHAPTGK